MFCILNAKPMLHIFAIAILLTITLLVQKCKTCENNVQAIEYFSFRDKSGLLQSKDGESHRVAEA